MSVRADTGVCPYVFSIPLTIRQQLANPRLIGVLQISGLSQVPFPLVGLAGQDMPPVALREFHLSVFGDLESLGDALFTF
jgi:hypothetical protein